ncbi:MAG: 50S ribosomal protein L4 [Proteobacteria bacterium]|nr:50S ribosomal protein L4 [Pseudomonadota bacterium]|tara:strand:- start:379 stop:999 length:621 start_codon:yes stop_codon:yes gene_type:complete
MEIKVLNLGDKKGSTLKVSDVVFDRKYNETLVHQLVVSHLSNGRQGTRAQKSRGQVRASGRKPWRQKGTGRARVGTVASPIWRGGGKVFPSSVNENFKKKINKKMFKAGMSTILSQLVRESRLAFIDEFKLDVPKTRVLEKMVKDLGFDSLLLVVGEVSKNLDLASRNLSNVSVVPVKKLDPVSLLKYENTVISKEAVGKFEEVFV